MTGSAILPVTLLVGLIGSLAGSMSANAVPTITEFPVSSPNGPGPVTANAEFVWFAEPNDDTIGRISPTGVVTEYPLPSPFQEPRGIAAAPDGTIWFTETGSHTGAEGIGSIDASGTIAEFPLPGGTLPFGITMGPDGNLWFTEVGFPWGIARMTPTGVVTEFPVDLHNEPLNIVPGPDGALWFTEDGIVNGGSGAIGRITTSGELTEWILPTPAGATSGAGDLAAGPDGNIWFTWATQASPDLAAVSRSIGRITPTGVITEFPVSSGLGWPPGGIALGPDGDMWFGTGAANDVGQISTSGVIVEHPVPSANAFPADVVTGPDGNIWFSEPGTSKMGRINLAPGSDVHERSISLGLTRHLAARGDVTSTEAVAACWEDVSVVIQHRVEGHWRSIETTRTNSSGAFRVQLEDEPGVYRARTKKITLSGGDLCGGAISPVGRHSHG